MKSNKIYYDIIPKFPAKNFLDLIILNINKVEYFLKIKHSEKSSVIQKYYLKTETETDYLNTAKNLNTSNILLFLRNDITYYLKLKKFNETNLKFITTKTELEDFFRDNGFQNSTVDLFYDRLKTRILKYDKKENGKNLPYSTIIKNDYTKFILMMRTDYFVILPHNTSIFTPNDLYFYTLPKQTECPHYSPHTITCFYNENIDGVKITSIRHLGEIMKDDIVKKEIWINRLENLKMAIYAYFKNNFNIDDTDKIFIYVRYPEYNTQSLKFYADYYGDHMAGNNQFYYMSTLIYLDDIIENIELSIKKEKDILFIKDYSYFTNNVNNSEQDKIWLNNKKSKKDIKEKSNIIIEKSNIITEKTKSDYHKKSFLYGGNPIPLDISKLGEYIWYFIEIKINSSPGYGYDDIIYYGKKDNKNYCLEFKFKKQDIIDLENFYNLFENYYIGYFDFEIILKEECIEKKIILYQKIKYDDEFKKNIQIKYNDDNITNNNTDINTNIISILLFNNIVPNTFKNFLKVIMENPLFENFNQEKCLDLLKLTLITKNNISKLKYSFELLNSDIKINNFTNNIDEETCKIILLLDNNSNYKFNLDPTHDKIFDRVESYNNYFFNLFTKILDEKNIIEYVGWFLPNNIFTFKNNITDVSDEDKIYLEDIHNKIHNCIIEYYKDIGIEILPENIILFYHNPSLVSGLHIRILVIKDLNKFLFQKEFLYTIQTRYIYSWNVISLLKLEIEYFKNYRFTIYPYKVENKKIQEITPIENKITSRIPINSIGGGLDIKDNFKKWIIIYINIKKINNIYKIKNFFIDFEIKIKDKNIQNINNYNKFIQYRLIMKDTYGNMFRQKLIKYFNIDIGNILLIKLLSLFNNNINNKNILFIGAPWTIKYSNNINNVNIFYIADNKNFNNFNIKYEKTYFDMIHITNNLDVITKPNTICEFFVKNISSLIWAFSHITVDGIICILIREISTSINKDLLLLLSQFSDIYISIDYTFSDPTGLPIQIIIKNIKNNKILIEYLTKISNFECKQELSFLNIKNNEEQIKIFDNTILKISNIAFKKIFDYMKIFEKDKYNTNYPNISKENEEYYLIKSTILFLIQYLYIESPKENDYYNLYELMKKTKTKRILQVGMNNGNWSVFILAFFKFLYHESDELYKLISIDPNQIIEYKNMGIDNLKNLNLGKYHKLVDDYSYIYMQKSIDKNKKYDIIFINEWITYDYTITDIFNSLKLLNTGGYLIIDGILNKSYLKIIEYIDNVYKHFIKINMGNINIAIYSKIE